MVRRSPYALLVALITAFVSLTSPSVNADPGSQRPRAVHGTSFKPSVQGHGYSRPYHHHVHGPSVRLWIGPPPLYATPYPYYGYPYPYAYPYPYRPVPPVVVVPSSPPVFVEQGGAPVTAAPPAGTAAAAAGYWYWCQSRAAYHPTAPDCPEGWVAVAPQQPAAQ